MDIRCVILQVHYYQPMFTLVGGGLKEFDDTHKSTQSVLPSNCDWLQTSVEGICPNENTVSTTDGRLVGANNISIVLTIVNNLYFGANFFLQNLAPA